MLYGRSRSLMQNKKKMPVSAWNAASSCRDGRIGKGMENPWVHGRYVLPCDFLPSLVDLMVHTKIHPKKEMIYKERCCYLHTVS